MIQVKAHYNALHDGVGTFPVVLIPEDVEHDYFDRDPTVHGITVKYSDGSWMSFTRVQDAIEGETDEGVVRSSE